MLEEIAGACGGDLRRARARIQRQADEIGTGFRIPGESEERAWPLSPLPLMIDEHEWAKIADGVVQRAELMELLLEDIYGAQRLTGNGLLPAALLNGSPHFLRPMVGLPPPGGHQLHFYAVDIGRGPSGEWRVLADHTRTPTGAGYALENRLAVARVFDTLQSRLNILRLAPFFAD
ncbi:MAG: circularly permuted type 2 ATP-grasp protein, partial [Sphingomonadaceae bacterium]|nr:circularly permuted type 2 ATP-grasp protein [Sphingomonadaceae bacterium]